MFGKKWKLKRKYRGDFYKYQTSVTRKRIGFFCLLSVFIYALFSGVSLLLLPRTLNPAEMGLVKIIVFGSALIYLLVRMGKGEMFVKVCAYIYTGLLLYVVTRLNLIYPEFIKMSAATYVFTLVFVCFSIPWDPIDTVNITGLHLIAYTTLFLYSPRYMTPDVKEFFDMFYYFGAVTFLCMGFILFFIVRRKDKKMEFDNFILLKEQESRNEQINKELALAAKVNETLVPRSISTNFADISVKYIPASYMSGDYARYHFIEKDLLLFIICDVTGHGVSSALLVNRMHTEFIRLIKTETDPEVILKHLNSFIVNEFVEVGMYVSSFCGLADMKNGELTYANYGHPSQYLYNSSGPKIEQIPSRTTLLGIIEDPELDPKIEIELNKGDRLFLFTDGLIEINNKKKEEYGHGRLKAFIAANSLLSPDEFNKKLLEEINKYKSGDFDDDIFLINILIKKTGEISKEMSGSGNNSEEIS